MITNRTPNPTPKSLGVLIHIICWIVVFLSPLIFAQDLNGMGLKEYGFHAVSPVAFLVIFYLNFFVSIPRLLFRQKTLLFIVANVVSIVVLAVAMRWTSTLFHVLPPDGQEPPPYYVFFFRDCTSLLFFVFICIAVKVGAQLQETEAERIEAVKSKTEAELKNLRNQINPHFLLNTLNNIYALISFDTEKAQQAVQELSKLLRYVLYDNQEMFVPLKKEAGFIMNYIELMRIRVSADVDIVTEIDIKPDSQTPIAPLIFISLIENAFKHGISPTAPSFIHIRLSEDSDCICFQIANSNHPKSTADKSGSGIGLEQVGKRLDLMYQGRHSWQRGESADKKEYVSTITIKL